MAAWTAGILLALGLAWFVGAVAVPAWKTRTVVAEFARDEDANGFSFQSFLDRLGEREQATARLSMYVRLPQWLAPDKASAAWLLGHCGKAAIPALIGVLREPDWHVRSRAAWALGTMGPDASAAIPAIARMIEEENLSARASATRALGGFRGQLPIKSLDAELARG
jgi:HEAT repeat protein